MAFSARGFYWDSLKFAYLNIDLFPVVLFSYHTL
jgi:hypothetical protein